MKILIIHPFFSLNGARGSEFISLGTYNILKNNGHKVFYFALNKKPYLENTEYTKYFPKFYNGFNPLKDYWNYEAQQKIEVMLNDIKPDIVHIHGTIKLTYSILKPIFEKEIPVIMTIHDTGILCPVRIGWDNKKKMICQKCYTINTLPCIINNCIQTKKRISSFNLAFVNFLEKISGYNKKINKFITPSLTLLNYITNKEIPSNKIIVIPNFLNNKFLNNINNNNNRNYFLYVGTLADYKGVNILLDAIKDLPRDIPFKIIGSGFQEKKYKIFAKEQDLYNIEFLGNLPREEIIKYYEKSISIIVPSNYFEIFGMINIEAFACGKPVIASNIGGIPEIVEDNINGLLFEPGNVEQLKKCILKYWNNQELAVEHGKNGYQKAITQYTEDKYYDKLIKVYEEVLNETK